MIKQLYKIGVYRGTSYLYHSDDKTAREAKGELVKLRTNNLIKEGTMAKT